MVARAVTVSRIAHRVSIMTTFKFLSYEEWIQHNPDAAKTDEKCPDCNGTGFGVCPHCGNDADCKTCEGSGTIETSREQYEAQLERDKKAAKNYAKLVN